MAGRIRSLKISKTPSGIEPETFSVVPQPTALPHAPFSVLSRINIRYKSSTLVSRKFSVTLQLSVLKNMLEVQRTCSDVN